MIFGFSHLLCGRLLDYIQKTFNRSQIICREKISGIPQSTSCKYQNIEIINHSIYIYNWCKSRLNIRKCMFLGFTHFCCEIFLDDLQKTFNKSQIICREKISEIPQSRSSCLDQNTKVQENSIYVWDLTQILEMWDKMNDFMIFTFLLWELPWWSQEKF